MISSRCEVSKKLTPPEAQPLLNGPTRLKKYFANPPHNPKKASLSRLLWPRHIQFDSVICLFRFAVNYRGNSKLKNDTSLDAHDYWEVFAPHIGAWADTLNALHPIISADFGYEVGQQLEKLAPTSAEEWSEIDD